MSAIRFLPFFYFQQTRLNSVKSFSFHFAYEWIPSIIIVLLDHRLEWNSLILLFFYYLAFISIYEIGYIVNDQAAFYTEGRTRSGKFSFFQLTTAIVIRLTVFIAIAFFTGNEFNLFWWEWYGALIIVFAGHNLLNNSLLKCITFSQLAFLRFTTPLVFLIEATTMNLLMVPVIFNYVFFRLLTYMDSKALIHFNRNTNAFRIGFYLILLPVSTLLSLIFQSIIPVGLNAYYVSLALIFWFVSRLGFDFKN